MCRHDGTDRSAFRRSWTFDTGHAGRTLYPWTPPATISTSVAAAVAALEARAMMVVMLCYARRRAAAVEPPFAAVAYTTIPTHTRARSRILFSIQMIGRSDSGGQGMSCALIDSLNRDEDQRGRRRRRTRELGLGKIECSRYFVSRRVAGNCRQRTTDVVT